MRGPVRRPELDVTCSGRPGEMGLSQGAQLAGQVSATRGSLADLEAFRLLQPWWLPYPAFLRFSQRKAQRHLQRPLAAHAPQMKARLEGIAEGAGIGRSSIYLLNALEVFMSSVGTAGAAAGAAGCSAVAVRGGRSATGEPIIAHNFDYLPLVQPFYVLRESQPVGGWRSLDFTAAPLCGTVDGINERGLAIVNNYAFVVDAGPPAPPLTMLVGRALEKCSTVAEAGAWIASQPRAGGGILMMADASGDIASLELSNTRSRLRRPDGDDDMLFHTNAFSCAETREVEVAEDAVHGPDAPRALREVRFLESSRRRDERFAARAAQPSKFGPDELAALMADHGARDEPDANTICMHSDYWRTTACIQLYPRSRRMRVAYAPACKANYEGFEL